MNTLKMIKVVTSMVAVLATSSVFSAPAVPFPGNIQIIPDIIKPVITPEILLPTRVPIIKQVSPILINKVASATKDYKTFHGSMCQPFSGSQQADIDHRDNGLYNRGARTRIVVCPIVRDNVNKTNGVWVSIFVNNPANSTFNCWADSRGPYGNVIELKHKTTDSSGNQNLKIDVYDMVAMGNFNLYCRVPPKGRIASYKTGEILRTDFNN